MLTVLLALGLAVVAGVARAEQNPFGGLSAQDVNGLLAGKITVSEGQINTTDESGNDPVEKSMVARLVVDRPIEDVWGIVRDQPLMFSGDPRVKSVKVIDKLSPSEEKVAYDINIGRMLPDFNYTTQVRYSKPEEVTFRRISGSFKDFRSQCRLYPIDHGKKTLVTYSMYVDFGMFIPKFVARAIIRQDIPSIAENVRKVVYQHTAH